VTVDGIDFAIAEPYPFKREINRLYYSHKWKCAGYRYEVAVCIQTGHIVWVNGPFRCGEWPDISIFRRNLRQLLLPGEKVEADKGYKGENLFVRTPDTFTSKSDIRAKDIARARHESVNKFFRLWGALKQKYRHDRKKHKPVFAAIAVITQLAIERHELDPFQVNY